MTVQLLFQSVVFFFAVTAVSELFIAQRVRS